MADEKTTIEIEVRAKDLSKNVLKSMGDNAKRAGNIATRSFAKVGRAAVKAATGVARMARGIAKGLTRAVTGLLGPLAALAGAGGLLFAVKSASDFRKKMAEVSTLLIGSGTNMDDLREKVLNMAQALGVNEIELAAGLYESLSSGVGSAAESLAFLEQATKLGVAGVAETAEAVNALTTVMNAWGKENFNVEKSADVLFKTVEGGKITMSGLASNLGTVASEAKSLEVPLEEMSAIIATLTAATNKVETSFSGTRAVMAGLTAATPPARAAFDRLGIDISSAAIKTSGLVSIFEQLAAAQLTPEQVNELFPGVEAQSAVKAITGNINKLTESLDAARASGGIFSTAFRLIFEDPATRISRTINSIRIEFVRMGDAILLGIDRAIQDAGGIEVLSDNFKILADVLGRLATSGVSALGKLVAGFTKFVELRGGPDVVSDLLLSTLDVLFSLLKSGANAVADSVMGMIEAIKLLPAAMQQVASEITFLGKPLAAPPMEDVEIRNAEGDLLDTVRLRRNVLGELANIQVGTPESRAADKDHVQQLTALWEQFKIVAKGVAIVAKDALPSPAGAPGETGVDSTTIPPDTFKKMTPDAETFFQVVERGATTFGILAESAEQFTLTLGSQLAGGVFDGFRGFFRDVISGAKSASDAIKDFGKQMLLMIADLIAQTIAFGIVKSIFGLPLGFPAFAKGGIVPVAKAAKGAVVGPGIHMSGAGPIEVGDNPERSEVILPLRHGPRGLGVESIGGAQSPTINFTARFESIDPRGAADVILHAMPQIEAKLTYALTSGTNAELIRAVGGA